MIFLFFKQKTAYDMRISDWSSDVCSSDLFQHEWEPKFLEASRDFIFRNTFKDIEYILKKLGEGHGVRFEYECYDVGHLYNLAHFLERGLVKPPLFVQTIFGILAGIGADTENLMHIYRQSVV